MNTILISGLVALGVAFLLGILLGVFKQVFHVETDPKVEEVRAVLPGANCGACGYPGCDGFAAAVAKGEAPTNGCTVGAAEVASKVSKIMGVEATSSEKKIVHLLCQGCYEVSKPKANYVGVKTCAAAKTSINGTKECDWGCIGFGDCAVACPFDAISVLDNGLVAIDEEKCTGCGICVAQCPQHILYLLPKNTKGALALCNCRNPRKQVIMKNCKRGCIKCGKCERVCAVQALKLVDGIPKIDYTTCTSCGACVEGCPTKVLTLIE